MARIGSAPARRKARRTWVLVVLLAVIAAGAVRAVTIEPRAPKPYLTDARPVVLAHRGFSGQYRENTIEAFDAAVQAGADILELDVWTTRDGVIVVHHDPAPDGSATPVRQTTWADLKAAAPWVPTLETVLDRYPGMRINIEIKQQDPPMETALLALIQQKQAQQRVLVGSFHGSVLERWRALEGARDIATSADTSSTYVLVAHYLTFTTRLWQPKADALQLPTSGKLGPFTVHLDTPRLLNAAHRLGVKVHYWTINDEAEMERLLRLGADGIITDYPDRAVRVMTRLGMR